MYKFILLVASAASVKIQWAEGLTGDEIHVPSQLMQQKQGWVELPPCTEGGAVHNKQLEGDKSNASSANCQ